MSPSNMLPTLFLSLLLFAAQVPAQDEAAQTIAPSPEPDRAQLEAEFARLLSGAKLVGYFTDDAAPEQAPARDSYTIRSATKLEGDKWRIESLVEYGGRSFTLPLAIDVLWAGTTPMMSLDNLTIPLMGTFSARVVFHGERYAGLWQGPGHGGHMYGQVVPAAAPEATAPGAPAQPDKTPEEKPKEGDGLEQGAQTDWPSFRGPSARGWANGYATPSTWDLTTGENVRWRTAIPGLAHSSPIVFGERIILSSAVRSGGEEELRVGLYGDPSPVPVEGEYTYLVMCVDKQSGEVLWERVVWSGTPRHARHPKSSYAASTPAADAKRVVVQFGSEGLFALDWDGNLLWQRDLGALDAGPYNMEDVHWGFASSPVLHGKQVLVQCDVLSQGFVAALDAHSGADLWRTPRDEISTWSTPTVLADGLRQQVLCNGWKHIGAYDLATGKEIWKLRGGGDAPVPTPIVAHDLIFITNAHGRMAPIYAIRTSATGELALEHEQMAWSTDKRGNYMQTPLVYGDELYCCLDSGVLTCYDARTGTEHYRERLGDGTSGFTASMIAADNKLYATSETGEVHVLAAGKSYAHLARVELGETCMATPALSAGTIYWRTRNELIAVGLP